MRIKETKLYTYDELSDAAKSRARDWYREGNTDFADFGTEYLTEDFHETLKAFGFDVMQRRGPNPIRSTVQWSGFWTQGSGAAFSGTWRAADFKPDALLENRPEVSATPNGENAKHADNIELHRIAAELRACAEHVQFAAIETRGRGFFMALSECEFRDETPESVDADATEERFIEAARDLAHGFYKALEAEYEYQNADEQVAENIIANEYEFTDEGERA